MHLFLKYFKMYQTGNITNNAFDKAKEDRHKDLTTNLIFELSEINFKGLRTFVSFIA